MPRKYSCVALAALAFCLFNSASASAQNREIVHFGRAVHVPAGQAVSEVTCILCSIYLASPAAGDVTAIGGSISLESGASVGGDVTAIAGNIRAESGVSVGGDATAIGGSIKTQPGTQIGGERTSMEGKGWLLLIFVLPFIVLGAIIAGVVWLIRYLLRPQRVATA
jgi:hypothetical protein